MVYIVLLIVILTTLVLWICLTGKRVHKYYWLIERDGIHISEGYYSYVPNVGDTIYYYVIDDFGAETPWLETGIVQKIRFYSHKREIYVYITTKQVEQALQLK